MATPTLVVTFDFSSGAVFGYPFIIGEGLLGFNTLADAAADTIDISDQVKMVTSYSQATQLPIITHGIKNRT